MHKLYGEQPLLALPSLFSSRANELRGDTHIQCSFSVGPLAMELFGARLTNGDKLISVPYVSAFELARQTLRPPEIEELGAFAKSPQAHEAIERTISVFNLVSGQLYQQSPVGLSRRQTIELFCISSGYYQKLRDGNDFTRVIEQPGTKNERIFLPPQGLAEIFSWEFPQSYPEDRAPLHPGHSIG